MTPANPFADTSKVTLTLAALSIATVVFMMVMSAIVQGRVATLELAKSADHAKEILSTFKSPVLKVKPQEALKWQLYLDFGFLICYSTLLAFACFRASVLAQSMGWHLIAAAGLWLGWCQWLAGGLDMVENGALLNFLARPDHNELSIAVSRWCAAPKFILTALGGLYAGLIFWCARGSSSQLCERIVGVLMILAALLFASSCWNGI